MPKAEMLSKLLAKASHEFARSGFSTPEFDAKLLLQQVVGFSSSEMISRSNEILNVEKTIEFWSLVERRLTHEPVHRILGYREFYGRKFLLSDETLIPRPDTETLVETVINLAPSRVLEIGTGSGAIAVSLAAELKDAEIFATDISVNALETASRNASLNDVSDRIQFIEADMYEGVSGAFDVIVSNPPYIPSDDISGLQEEVRLFDPLLALDGGADGLDCYRSLFKGAKARLSARGKVCVEIGIGQEDDVAQTALAHGFLDVAVIKDLNQINRVIVATA